MDRSWFDSYISPVSSCYYRRSEPFKMNLCLSKVFGSRGGATEILTMISVQKCQFLAISQDWTNVNACCSFKLIINNNEGLVYIHGSIYLCNKN